MERQKSSTLTKAHSLPAHSSRVFFCHIMFVLVWTDVAEHWAMCFVNVFGAVSSIKNYGHIAHFPKSRMGEGDHKCHEGQSRIATVQIRDKYNRLLTKSRMTERNWKKNTKSVFYVEI